jgi:type IV secretory pathway VirB2 component (pilin)
MQNIITRYLVVSFMFLTILLPAYNVSAGALLDSVGTGGLNDIGTTAYQQGTAPTDVRLVVTSLLRQILGFTGIVLVIIIIWAGVQWMTAGGDPKKVETAKTWLQNAVIGLIIIFSAFTLTDFILSCVINSVNGSKGGYIWGGICG